MADISEVSDALRDLCEPLIYPNGISQPSIVNAPVKIYSGKPLPQMLDDDLSIGISHINIFPMDTERNTSRFLHAYENLEPPQATIFLTVLNNAITITGSPAEFRQFCSVIVNHTTYAYEVQDTDTLDIIAENIANLIPSAVAISNTITIPNAYKIIARVGMDASVRYETKRQEKCFMVQVWAPDFQKRDILGKQLDTYLPANYHFTLHDQIAKLTYTGSHQVDEGEKQILYRRILYFNVEYSTNYDVDATIVTSTNANVEVEYE